MDLLFLVIIAVLPPIAFMLYIHHLDRIEPEPHGFILKVIMLGGAAVIPAALAEVALSALPFFGAGGFVGAALKSFIVIAPVEEAVKLAVVLLFVWKNKNFNEENDGIVYVGAAAIGFAMVENVMYVLQHGLGTGIMRALTSVPLHTFTGVLMGYFVGIAKFAPSSQQRNRFIIRGFCIAYLVHAVYDTFALSSTAAALLILPLVVALFVFGIIYLKRGAALSARRWGGSAPAAAPAVEAAPASSAAAPAAAAKSGSYKIIISRVIFALCGMFWALLIAGMSAKTSGDASMTDILAGGIIITIIPIFIGIILEISYQRYKKHAGA